MLRLAEDRKEWALSGADGGQRVEETGSPSRVTPMRQSAWSPSPAEPADARESPA